MRGRKAAPISDLDQHDFDKLARAPGLSKREQLRFIALAHIQDGKRFTEAARMLRISPRVVIKWVAQFRKEGLKGLKDRYRGRKKAFLMPDKYEEFRQLVSDMQKERTGGRVRGKDIQEMLRKKFAIECSLSTVYDTLRRAGMVWITGRSQHPKGDKEAQDSFKKNFWKKSKKLSDLE